MKRWLEELIDTICEATGLEQDEVGRLLEIPPKFEMGHFALPCFTLARQLKKSPQDIAKNLAERFCEHPLVEKAVPEGAYLNFFLRKDVFIRRVLEGVLEEGERFGESGEGEGKCVVVDFSSPNIAKPFGVGHLRSTVIGNSLCKIYEALGYKCVRINHLGDWGTQFGNLIAAYKRWGEETALEEDPIGHMFQLYVRFHKEADEDPSLYEEGRHYFKQLEEGDGEARRLWGLFRELSLREFGRIYELLGIEFDEYTGESFHIERARDLIRRLQETGLAQKSQDALIVDLQDYNMPPCLIQKSDESTLYATRDLAAAEYRWEKYRFHKMLYVVGAPQRLHFQQVFRVLELMGYEWVSRCVHVEFGLIHFGGSKMSTRRGNIVLLEEVLEEAIARTRAIIEEKNPTLENKEEVAKQVGVGAVVFADLSISRIKDYDFSWEEVLNFDGRTGPYLQYSFVRANSVLRKFGSAPNAFFDAGRLSLDEEFIIARAIAQFPGIIKRAAERFEPSIIANYALDLAEIFNNYYHHYRIIGGDKSLTDARIVLTYGVRQVLGKALELLGMARPEKM